MQITIDVCSPVQRYQILQWAAGPTTEPAPLQLLTPEDYLYARVLSAPILEGHRRWTNLSYPPRSGQGAPPHGRGEILSATASTVIESASAALAGP